MSSLVTRLRFVCRSITIAVLAVAVSGGMAPALQGIAWIEMARDAGGMHRIGDAMFEFSPCGRCHAAQKTHGSDEAPERPNPLDRGEPFRVLATLDSSTRIPRPSRSADIPSFPRTSSEPLPASRGDRPPSPPPRAAVLA